MDIEDLRSPHPSDFIQPSREDDINPPATDLFIGKQALAALFYDDGDGLNGKDETYHEYSRELIELIVENETPFSTIHTTRETLNIAVTSLDHRRNNREAADTCLDTVLNNDLFQIHHCELTEYVRSVDCFVDYNPRDISIQEVILANRAQDCGISHLMTWDSDFTRYTGDLTLYPRNYWE